MIRYALKCAEGHAFDSWFHSAEAFDALQAKRMLACAVCGGGGIEKALMAPGVSSVEATDARPPTALATPSNPVEAALRAMRDHLQKTSTYVGGDFARDARAMHLGDLPERPIHGEAAPADARALIEDGVPILPLPFLPKDKAN